MLFSPKKRDASSSHLEGVLQQPTFRNKEVGLINKPLGKNIKQKIFPLTTPRVPNDFFLIFLVYIFQYCHRQGRAENCIIVNPCVRGRACYLTVLWTPHVYGKIIKGKYNIYTTYVHQGDGKCACVFILRLGR